MLILRSVLKTAAVLTGGTIIHKIGKDKAYKKGYNRGKEEKYLEINMLIEQLNELQKERENVKDNFKEIVEDISKIDMKEGFFSKIAVVLRGYTYLYIYVLGIISLARIRCLELNLPDDLSEELKNIVLGFTQGGFPDNLKKDITDVWNSSDIEHIQNKFTYCKNKIPNHLEREFSKAISDIDQVVRGLHGIYEQENNIKLKIDKLKKAI